MWARRIVVDVFSSDAIPLHLLTQEALTTYLAHLFPNGLVLMNISNRYLNLARAITRTSQALVPLIFQRLNIDFFLSDEDLKHGKSASQWLLLAQRKEDLTLFDEDKRWRRPVQEEDAPIWTDDYSDIVSVLEF